MRPVDAETSSPALPRSGVRLGVETITVISYSPLGDCAVSHIPLYKGNVNGKSIVVYDEVPNPCYNEYICYISPLQGCRGLVVKA